MPFVQKVKSALWAIVDIMALHSDRFATKLFKEKYPLIQDNIPSIKWQVEKGVYFAIRAKDINTKGFLVPPVCRILITPAAITNAIFS